MVVEEMLHHIQVGTTEGSQYYEMELDEDMEEVIELEAFSMQVKKDML
jgi:hypothetical protein